MTIPRRCRDIILAKQKAYYQKQKEKKNKNMQETDIAI